jgi:two-component system, chemotaxis family, response regulator Rcp1
MTLRRAPRQPLDDRRYGWKADSRLLLEQEFLLGLTWWTMGRRGQVKSTDECVVLYVEDDDANAYLFQLALREANLWPQLFRVTDGEEATSFIARTGVYESAPRPDLILLDLNLPRRSGFDVLADIRQHPQLSTVPVIVFSTSDHEHDYLRAMRLGASEYFAKPDNFDRLVEIASSVCQMLPSGPFLKSA